MSEDERRFGEMVDAHKAELARYLRRRVPPHDVDDVLADVFANAWRHWASLPDPATLWLYRSAWNAVLHYYRGARRRERLFRRAVELQEPPETGDGFDHGDRVRDALLLMSPTDQELLRLAYWEDLDAAEIAYVIGGTAGAVRVRLHRARKRLGAILPDLAPQARLSGSPDRFERDPTLITTGRIGRGAT